MTRTRDGSRSNASSSRPLVDKVALVSLVGIAYAKILPDVHANAAQLAFGVGALVIASAVMSERLARNEVPWRSPTAEFATLCAVNAPMMFALNAVRRTASRQPQ